MNAGLVADSARRTCVALSVTGTVLLMTGVLLGIVGNVLGTALAVGLIAAGLACGAIMIVVTTPGGRPRARRPGRPRGQRRVRAPRPATQGTARPGTAAESGTSEEWISSLRPGPAGPDQGAAGQGGAAAPPDQR